jgi:hypothetical protein
VGLDQVIFAVVPEKANYAWSNGESIVDFRKCWVLVHKMCEAPHVEADDYDSDRTLTREFILELGEWAKNPSAVYPERVDGWYDEPEAIDNALSRLREAIPKMLAKLDEGLVIVYGESM